MVELLVAIVEEVHLGVMQMRVAFFVLFSVNTTEESAHSGTSLGRKFAVENDNSPLARVFGLVFEVTIIGDKFVQDLSVGVQINSTLDMSSFVFVRITAVHDNKTFDDIIEFLVQNLSHRFRCD